MYNLNGNYFCKQKKWTSPQNVFNLIHYKKTANIIGIFATSCFLSSLAYKCTFFGTQCARFAGGD